MARNWGSCCPPIRWSPGQRKTSALSSPICPKSLLPGPLISSIWLLFLTVLLYCPALSRSSNYSWMHLFIVEMEVNKLSLGFSHLLLSFNLELQLWLLHCSWEDPFRCWLLFWIILLVMVGKILYPSISPEWLSYSQSSLKDWGDRLFRFPGVLHAGEAKRADSQSHWMLTAIKEVILRGNKDSFSPGGSA